MSSKTLIIDNDVFVLLAAAGQLEQSIDLLGFEVAHSRRLSALPHMLSSSLAGKSKAFRQFPAEHRRRAVDETKRFSPLIARSENDKLVELLAPYIKDDAELYATVALSPAIWLHSGDVLAMRKVCGVPELAEVKVAVMGRVVSLESLVYQYVEALGYQKAAMAFAPVRELNHKLQCLFPAGGSVDDDLQPARSYLGNLCGELGPGFMMCPPCRDFPTTGVCRLAKPPDG